MAELDVYDVDRDARTFPGGIPVIAHPPCRAWGRLRTFAKPRADEKALALFAVEAVRVNGGVLEHPASSTLWREAGLPAVGQRDAFGGWTLGIHQCDFGHRAMKPTWLYIVGVELFNVPRLPLPFSVPSVEVASMGKAERERTPVELATWLIDLASRSSIRAGVSG